jgi:hypothetical protein
MSGHPSIAVKITASAPTFNLYQSEPLTIRLTLNLAHRRPITFLKRYTGLFDGKIFHEGGLTFTNTATGQYATRNRIDLCYMGACDCISWAIRSDYITLYPGRDHVIEHAIHPMNSPNKRANTERWSKHMPLLALAGLAGFENGQTYKIGVSDEAVVNEWIEGTIWEILGWQMLGWTPEGKREKIEYTVIEAASLKVRRDKADEPVEEPWPEPAKLNTAEQTMPALTLPVKYQRPEDCAEELSEQSRRCLENRGRHGSVHSVPSSYHGFASRISRAATKHYIKKSFNIVD